MTLSRLSSLAAALVLASASWSSAQTAGNPTGHWEGAIQIPNRQLTFAVDLARNAAGTWAGSLTVLNTTTADVPLTDIAVENGTVRFAAGLPGKTSFEGTLSADANELAGTVANAQGGVPFQLTRKGDANVKVPPRSSMLTKAFEGTWQGIAELGGQPMRVQVTLTPGADGTAVATLANLDKGGEEIPVSTVTIQDAELKLDVRVVSGTFRGTLGAGGEIAGEWSEAAARVPLVLKRVQ